MPQNIKEVNTVNAATVCYN